MSATASVIKSPSKSAITPSSLRQSKQTAGAAPAKLQLDLAQRLYIGMRLTELREEKGLSQMQVARQALGFDVSHAAVSRLERGVLDEVEGGRLSQLAAFFGETLESLVAKADAEDLAPTLETGDYLLVAPGYGDRLFHLRQALGCTAVEMSEILGHENFNSELIRDRESEKISVRPDTLLNIAVTLGVSSSWLITGKKSRPAAPTLSMRVRAMQKLYGLSNREVALLGEMDIVSGTPTVHRITRGRSRPTREQVLSVAKAFDVPVAWINPPTERFEPLVPVNTVPDICEGLSPRAAIFVREMAELFSIAAVTDTQISALRTQFMRELMDGLRPAKKPAVASPIPRVQV